MKEERLVVMLPSALKKIFFREVRKKGHSSKYVVIQLIEKYLQKSCATKN